MAIPREVKLTTTGTQSPVTFDDLGGRSFTHPTTDFDMLSEFSYDELSKSTDLQNAITLGYITLEDEDDVTLNSVELLNILNQPNGTADPTVNDDAADGYSRGSYWINTADQNKLWFCVDNTVGAAIWVQPATSALLLGVPSFSGSFFDSASPYLEYNSTSWQTAMAFPFEGTNILQLAKVVIIASRNGTSGTSSMRIYDVTNNNEISLITWSAADAAIYEDNTLTNLPSGQAIFEVQLQKSATSASKSQLWSLMIY